MVLVDDYSVLEHSTSGWEDRRGGTALMYAVMHAQVSWPTVTFSAVAPNQARLHVILASVRLGTGYACLARSNETKKTGRTVQASPAQPSPAQPKGQHNAQHSTATYWSAAGCTNGSSTED